VGCEPPSEWAICQSEGHLWRVEDELGAHVRGELPADDHAAGAAAHKVSVPTQQRLRRHDQPLSTTRREYPAERREEGAIGCSEQRPRVPPTKHRQLIP